MKETVDPEDRLLFEDMAEEDSTRPSTEATGSWLRFMEYGDGGSMGSIDRSAGALSFTPDKPHEYTTTKQERIEASFSASTPTHHEKPELVAEAVWEVLPDELACCFDFGVVVGVSARCEA